MNSPRPVLAKMIGRVPRAPARDPDYDYDRRCSGCGRVPEQCVCDEVDAARDRERYG